LASDDEIAEEEPYDEDEDEEPAEDHFDIMSFLSSQADEVESEEQTAIIDDFINGSETTLEVSLEQLIAFTRKKK